jgi:hypothetical protein
MADSNSTKTEPNDPRVTELCKLLGVYLGESKLQAEAAFMAIAKERPRAKVTEGLGKLAEHIAELDRKSKVWEYLAEHGLNGYRPAKKAATPQVPV